MSRLSSFAAALLLLLLLPGAAGAASSWSPALLVNTEAFQVIDDSDAASDIVLRFGATLNRTLAYDRAASAFRFNDDVYVAGTLSGAIIKADAMLASSGALVFEGAASGSSLYLGTSLQGAGLSDCDNATTSKLLWDATTGRFSCGADQNTTAWSSTGSLKTAFDERYVNTAGDTMTGALTIDLITGTVGLVTREMMSGAFVHASSGVSTSGSLVVNDVVTIKASSSGTALKQARLSVDHLQLASLEGGVYLGGVGVRERFADLADQGATWAARESSRNWQGVAMSSDGEFQTAVVYGGQIYTSSDYGATWAARDSSRDWSRIAMSADGKVQTAVVYGGQAYTSSDYGATWAARDSSRNWIAVAMSSDGKVQTAVVGGGQIYTSSDYGATWAARDSARDWLDVVMSSDGRVQTAHEADGLIYTSADSGATWTAQDDNRNRHGIAMSADGKVQAAAVYGEQLRVSTDYGVTWAARDSVRNWHRIAMSADGKVLTAAVSNGLIYTSADYGATWAARDSSRDWSRIAMSSDGKVQTAVVYGGQIHVSHATAAIPGGMLTVSGTMSGMLVRAQGTLASSGTLVFEGAASGSSLFLGTSLSGAGLSDCDNATTSKLLWDAAAGRFSCGTDQTGGGSGGDWSNTGALMGAFDARYVNTAGDTMTGALTIQNGNTPTATANPLVNVRGVLSGAILRAQTTLASSGTLVVEGAVLFGNSPADLLRVRSSVSGSLIPDADDAYDLGSSSLRWRDLFLSGGTLHLGSSDLEGQIGYNATGSEGLRFFAGGSAITPVLFLSSGGLVGVNTGSPGQLLHLRTQAGDAALRFEIAAEGGATTAGPLSGGTFADDSGIGTAAWSNVSNAGASDDASASAFTSMSSTHYLKATNFGFTVPDGAVIDGIVAEVERFAAMASVSDNAVRIVKGGVIGSTDRSAGGAWATTDSDTYTSYGSPTDLWGESWTAADINASSFGVAVSAADAGVTSPQVDHIRITVHYTTGSAAGRDWTAGVDYSDDSKFKVSQATSLGASDRLTITSSGSVGIGTAAPDTRLEVVGTISGSLLRAGNLTVSGAVVYTSGSTLVGTAKGASGQLLVSRGTGTPEWKTPSGAMTWYLDGTLAAGSGQGAVVIMPFGMTLTDVDLKIKGAPTGQSLIVDINENGASLFSTRPEIDAGQTREDGNHVLSDTALAEGAEVRLDVDQVGSTFAGSGLTIMLKGMRRY